jgi:hypothetical protein
MDPVVGDIEDEFPEQFDSGAGTSSGPLLSAGVNRRRRVQAPGGTSITKAAGGRSVVLLILFAAAAFAIALAFLFSQPSSGRTTIQGHNFYVTNCASAWQSLSGSKPLNGLADLNGSGLVQIDDPTWLLRLTNACSTAIAGRDRLTILMLVLAVGFGVGAALVYRRQGVGVSEAVT